MKTYKQSMIEASLARAAPVVQCVRGVAASILQ